MLIKVIFFYLVPKRNGTSMKLSEHLENYLSSKPLRISTKDTYRRTFKVLGLLDMDIEDFSIDDAFSRIQKIPNHNTRRTHSIVLRAVLGERPGFKLLPITATLPKHWDLPDEETLRWAVEQSRWWKILYLCMYAGLRVGEACAIRPTDLKGNRLIVQRQISQNGILQPAKTVGSVVVPDWLGEFIKNMDANEWWEEGKPSLRLTNHCFKLSKKTGVKVTPHLLRHWYATHLIKATHNPELVRRQLRHARLDTTLQVYAQVESTDLDALVNAAFK
jgi:integrase